MRILYILFILPVILSGCLSKQSNVDDRKTEINNDVVPKVISYKERQMCNEMEEECRDEWKNVEIVNLKSKKGILVVFSKTAGRKILVESVEKDGERIILNIVENGMLAEEGSYIVELEVLFNVDIDLDKLEIRGIVKSDKDYPDDDDGEEFVIYSGEK